MIARGVVGDGVEGVGVVGAGVVCGRVVGAGVVVVCEGVVGTGVVGNAVLSGVLVEGAALLVVVSACSSTDVLELLLETEVVGSGVVLCKTSPTAVDDVVAALKLVVGVGVVEPELVLGMLVEDVVGDAVLVGAAVVEEGAVDEVVNGGLWLM